MKKWVEMIGETVWYILIFGVACGVLGEWYVRLTAY